MKYLIVLGSRNPEGRTAMAAAALREGLWDGGSDGQKVFLPEMKIERCRQCEENGWGICRKEGRCVIDDDFAPLVDKVRNVDGVIFATPVYFGDLSESIHAFLGRLRRITRHEAGRKSISNKPAIGICVAGGRGGGTPTCAVSLEKVLSTCGFDVVDMIPVRWQNLDLKVSILRTTGKWLTTYVFPEQKP